MKQLRSSTTLGMILNAGAGVCIALGYNLAAAILSLIAYFASIKEVSKYTSWYQFINVYAASVLLGLSVNFPFSGIPFLLFSAFFAAVGSITRIVFFRVFSYTGLSWFEPSLFLLALTSYVIGNIKNDHHWMGYVFPAPLIFFNAVLAWGIIKDKKQLLAYTRGGYKVKIGQLAEEFALPDQDGHITKLSDFRGQRHLLVIFVRGDWCPGCHMMLRTYERERAKFASKNILVMAIGPDPIGVNRNMVEKLGLDFKVLADEGQRTAMVYGVQLDKYDNDFAEKYEEGIPLPASFLIDKNGFVRYVSRPDKVGQFLNPSLIFPIIDQLDGNIRTKETQEPKEMIKSIGVSKQEKANMEATIIALKKQLNNYESIIDQANDAMIVIDIVDGTIHQSNPSASKLLEYTKEELEKLTLFQLHPKEFLQRSSSIVADVWEKGGLIYKDIPLITKTGKLIPVECSARVAPFAGRPAIVIYARDITERLRLEKEVDLQRAIIEEKNKDITDSIEYSKRIQSAVFIEKEKLKEYAPESFIFFKPRDVVSGDFYWFHNYEIKKDIRSDGGFGYKAGAEVLVVAAVDCTGHGVPGAFMSIIGNTMLNQILNHLEVTTAASALDYLDAEMKNSLNKENEEMPLRDGMDIALCFVDIKDKQLEFAGANNPLYLVRNKELIKIAADKQPITPSREYEHKPFTNHKVELQKGDCVYLFTDGFADQFGGPKGKKFLYKQFQELLVRISNESMEDQKRLLYEAFEAWRGNQPQVDDVLVIGIRI
jgi:PAS domain S-box-containing protein